MPASIGSESACGLRRRAGAGWIGRVNGENTCHSPDSALKPRCRVAALAYQHHAASLAHSL
jgi:hypothetical protein